MIYLNGEPLSEWAKLSLMSDRVGASASFAIVEPLAILPGAKVEFEMEVPLLNGWLGRVLGWFRIQPKKRQRIFTGIVTYANSNGQVRAEDVAHLMTRQIDAPSGPILFDGIDARPITLQTLTIRVPETGVVRVPDGGYPHDFASVPNGWREIADVSSRYVVVPFIVQPKRPWR